MINDFPEIKDKYTFVEINQFKRDLPLERKIEISVEILRQTFALSKHRVSIAFSGGKDSTVLCDLAERFLPEEFKKAYCIFGNTGCEFPESIRFARKYGKEHFGDRFYETKFLRLKEDELRYDFAKKLVSRLEEEGSLDEVLKADGKLKGQKALIEAAKKRGYELTKENCFFKGHPMTFMYCLEQYGAPLLGKESDKSDIRKINMDCILKYSTPPQQR